MENLDLNLSIVQATDHFEVVDDVVEESGLTGNIRFEEITVMKNDGSLHTIKVPWYPTAWQASMQNGKAVSEALPAPHINILRRLKEQMGDKKLAQDLLRIAAKDILLKGMPRLETNALQGNLVFTSRLPAGLVVITSEFIYVSSHYVAQSGHKIDGDGDAAAACFNPNTPALRKTLKGYEHLGPIQIRPIVFVKDPMTVAVRTLYMADESILSVIGKEPWYPCTPAEMAAWVRRDQELRSKELEARKSMTETAAVWRKAHEMVNVGTADVAVKSFFLVTTAGQPLARRQLNLYAGKIAFNCIEMGGLGAARKDHVIGTDEVSRDVALVKSNTLRLSMGFSPLLTRTGSIGALSDWKANWVWAVDMTAHMKDVANLKGLTFEVPKPPLEKRIRYLTDRNPVVGNMVKGGVLRIEEIPNTLGHDLPPAVKVQLARPTKNGPLPVGLTNLPKSQGVSTGGLNYTFILPPVFSSKTGEWVHPVDHMAEQARPVWKVEIVEDEDGNIVSETETLIQGFDARIINQEGQVTRYWTQSSGGQLLMKDLWELRDRTQSEQNPGLRHGYKVNKLMEFLGAYIGRYGLVLPTDAVGRLEAHNTAFAVNSCVVDYGGPEEAWNDDLNLAKFHQIQPAVVCPASKGDDQRVRKYPLVRTMGDVHPWYANKGSNPRRAGQIFSQLVRSRAIQNNEGKMVPMRVAMVIPTPLTGNVPPQEWGEANHPQITASGIAKQDLGGKMGNTVFNDRVVHNEPLVMVKDEQGQVVLDEQGEPKMMLDPDYQQVEFFTLTGVQRVAWVTRAKASKKIGKLVTTDGQKFMPMPTLGFAQAWTEEAGMPMVGQVLSLTHSGEPQEVTVTAVEEDRIVFEHVDGRRATLSKEQVLSGNFAKVRNNVDIFMPIQELVDKGCFQYLLERAKEEVVHLGDGSTLVCYVYEQMMYRTSTPTENMRVRATKRRIRGFNGHLVVAGAQRGNLLGAHLQDKQGVTELLGDVDQSLLRDSEEYWEVKPANVEYCQTLKSSVLEVLKAFGHKDLLPIMNDLSYAEYELFLQTGELPVQGFGKALDGSMILA